MTETFADRLAEAVRAKASCLVVGLDPVLERLPPALLGSTDTEPRQRAADAAFRFNEIVLEAIAPYACAVKPQIAFYEQWGPAGIRSYEQTIARAHALDLLVIGDVKRGDIGSTAQAYARAHLASVDGVEAADAITLNAYLGTDSVAPFLEAAARERAGVFVLVRTSNPSASELQDLPVDGRPLHEHVAQLVRRWGQDLMGQCGYSSVGAVVGATSPEHVRRLRACLPHAWLLLPGVGAQGASADDVAGAFGDDGLGALVTSSRGILYAQGPGDWPEAVRDAARTLRDALRRVARLAPA